jgi:hypothetical protein
MHCQKSGLDIGTWTAVRYQLWFRQDVINIALVVNLYLYFQFCLSFGAEPATNSLPFGNAKRYKTYFCN